jgi:flagellar motility protein MotE (MotC chaperone)
VKKATVPKINQVARPINKVARKLTGKSDYALTRKAVRDSLVSIAGLIGRWVEDQDGKRVGKLVDIVVRHGEENYPPLTGLIVKVGQRKSFIDSAMILQLTQNEIKLNSLKLNLKEFTRRPGESLLDADVLDHQIVDVDGLRVVRTSDLYLAQLDRAIRLVGVDTTFKTFLRRLLPGSVSRTPTPDQVIDWASVASLTQEGTLQTSNSRDKLGKLRPADLADLIEDLDGREQSAFVSLLDPEIAADALEEMEEDDLQSLLRALPVDKGAQLISHMEPDEAAEILRELSWDHRESILEAISKEDANQLRKLLTYDEETAGGIMTPRIISCKDAETVDDALKKIIANQDHDISDGVIVINSKGELIDHIALVELISAKPTAKLSELVGEPFPVSVHFNAELDIVVEEFKKNRGSSIVVIDDRKKPIGRIFADDLVDTLVSQKEVRGLAQGSGALS